MQKTSAALLWIVGALIVLIAIVFASGHPEAFQAVIAGGVLIAGIGFAPIWRRRRR